ncbi:MAG: redox-regulated ATPase YchF [Chloroflexi bacterium]|nr:redox-regulated ATPase YchF [Chloroflexota bacterium]
MRIAIVGLPQSGKTTVFNALTRGSARVGEYSARPEANIGVAHVPDSRVDRLAEIYVPKKAVFAEVTYVDLPGPPAGTHDDSGMFSGSALTDLQQADALLHVVRAFADDSIIHTKGSVDWKRDAGDVAFDILFADIALIDRRIERLGETKGLKAADRDEQLRQIEDLKAVQAALEAGTPIREQSFNDSQTRSIQNIFLVSSLPYLVALNIGESDVPNTEALEAEISSIVTGQGTGSAAICGSLEMELAQMEHEEESEFRQSLDVGEPGLHRMLRLSYDALNLMSFLTVGDDEVRAWTIPNGTPAVKAAGAVHSDIERGFIRAEIVSYDDLVELGSTSEARKAARLRSEGRDYVMQNGDVVNFLFSV